MLSIIGSVIVADTSMIATDNEDDSDQMPPDHLGDASDNNA